MTSFFIVSRLLGTPNETIWPGVSQHRDWHEFPQWRPQDLSLAVPGLSAVGLDLLAVSLSPDVKYIHTSTLKVVACSSDQEFCPTFLF
jgi:cyclin-dependent kinase